MHHGVCFNADLGFSVLYTQRDLNLTDCPHITDGVLSGNFIILEAMSGRRNALLTLYAIHDLDSELEFNGTLTVLSSHLCF